MSKEQITPEMQKVIAEVCNTHYNQGIDHAIFYINQAITINPDIRIPLMIVVKHLETLKYPKPQPINTNTNDSQVQ